MARWSQRSGSARTPYLRRFANMSRPFAANNTTAPRFKRPWCCCREMRSELRTEYRWQTWKGAELLMMSVACAVPRFFVGVLHANGGVRSALRAIARQRVQEHAA